MRVGRTFSVTLEPASEEPLFSDQPLGLLPEELWHSSAKVLLQGRPTPDSSRQDASNAGSAAVTGAAQQATEGDWDSDDSLQPYDMPEPEDKSELPISCAASLKSLSLMQPCELQALGHLE